MATEDSTHPSLLWRIASSPEQSSWEEFSSRYGLLIHSYCQRAGLAADDREELLQEVFQALLRSLPNFRYDKAKGGFRAYLRQVVRNQAIALSKRRLADPLPLHPDHEEFLAGKEDPDEIWEEEWRKHHLREAFERLERETPPEKMRVFRLYALEKKPVEEVASSCGCSETMVYKTKSLLMARMRKIVKQRIALEG